MSGTTGLDAAVAGERSRLGVGTAVVIGALGVATLIASLQLGLWTKLGPGPGFFPFWLGMALAGASVFWGRQQWRGEGAPEVEEGEEANGPWMITAMVASIVIAALLLEPLGFQATILLFLLFQLRVLHRVRWIVTVPIVLLGSLGVFTLFDLVLGVRLPISSMPFLAAIGL
jgi:putative tricarboxylic transport membrane protein